MERTVTVGTLEVLHEEGTVYFHVHDPEKIGFDGVTMLRIKGLPTPIPKNAMLDLDIRHSGTQNWQAGD